MVIVPVFHDFSWYDIMIHHVKPMEKQVIYHDVSQNIMIYTDMHQNKWERLCVQYIFLSKF